MELKQRKDEHEPRGWRSLGTAVKAQNKIHDGQTSELFANAERVHSGFARWPSAVSISQLYIRHIE